MNPDAHKAAVAGRALFKKPWPKLNAKQRTEARALVEAINAAPKEPKETRK